MATISLPLPLLDACRCVATGRHMGSATFLVSAFIISIVVAGAVAALGQVQGGAVGADAGRPLFTMSFPIPLLVAFLPSNTAAAGAVRGATELCLIILDRLAAAGALCIGRYALE